jgi:integrase
VIELFEAVAETKPIMANRAFSVGRRFYSWLAERDDVVRVSPFTGVKPPTEKEMPRERVLSDSEIKRLWLACDTVGGPSAAAIKLLLLCGQRRSEVAEMTWSEIEGDTWRLSGARTKNGKPHDVPLSRQALAVIEQQPRISGCDAIFTSGGKPINNFSRIKAEIDKIMPPETPPWVVHDLRRTVASGMGGLSVALPVIEKVLNHASGSFRGIVAVYQRHDYANEKRAALARWGDHVERIVKGKEPGKIVTLR